MAQNTFNPINILDTTDATGVGSGGSLTIGGGASIGKDFYVGGNISISGTTTSFSDNILLINKNPTNSCDTGLLFQRFTNDISNDQNYSGILYSEISDEFHFGYMSSDISRSNATIDSFVRIKTNGINSIGNSNTLGNIFTTGGNVGVSTSSPTTTLDVNGTLKATTITTSNIIVPGFINTQTDTINTTIQPDLIGAIKDNSIHYWSKNDNISSTTYVNWGPVYDEFNESEVKGISNISGTDLLVEIKIVGTAENNATDSDITGTFYIANSSGSLISTIYEYTVNNAIPGEGFMGMPTPGVLSIDTGYITVTIPQGGSIQSKDNYVNDSTYLLIQNPYVYINVVNLKTNIPTLLNTNAVSTNISATNISVGTLNLSTGITTASALITNSSIGTLFATNITATNIMGTTISTGRLIANASNHTLGTMIISGGNVGIGVWNNIPRTALHVQATNLPTLLSTWIGGTGGSSNSIDFSYSVSSFFGTAASARIKAIDNSYSADIAFQNRNQGFDNSTMNTRMFIAAAGNVGINTTSPAYTLDVNGTIDATSITTGQLHSTNITSTNIVGTNVSSTNIVTTALTAGSIRTSNIALNGNLVATGDITAFGSLSDIRLKTNIVDIDSEYALNTVRSLRPVTFDWKSDIFNISKRGFCDVGFIAQEVEEIIPQAVAEYQEMNSGTFYKNIKHERLIPYLVGAIKKLEYINKKLEQFIHLKFPNEYK
jgi:hypothetical protein